jgi:hypothetical protein
VKTSVLNKYIYVISQRTGNSRLGYKNLSPRKTQHLVLSLFLFLSCVIDRDKEHYIAAVFLFFSRVICTYLFVLLLRNKCFTRKETTFRTRTKLYRFKTENIIASVSIFIPEETNLAMKYEVQ